VRVPLRVTLALQLGLLMAYADSRTIRSASAKAEFKRMHPCPATGARSGPCGAYVIAMPHLQSDTEGAANARWCKIAYHTLMEEL
jgi:hypothetical protein